MASKVLVVAVFIVCTFWGFAESSKDKEKKEKEKTKINKNILDYSESDVYRLLDQWDVSNNYFFFVYLQVDVLYIEFGIFWCSYHWSAWQIFGEKTFLL